MYYKVQNIRILTNINFLNLLYIILCYINNIKLKKLKLNGKSGLNLKLRISNIVYK